LPTMKEPAAPAPPLASVVAVESPTTRARRGTTVVDVVGAGAGRAACDGRGAAAGRAGGADVAGTDVAGATKPPFSKAADAGSGRAVGSPASTRLAAAAPASAGAQRMAGIGAPRRPRRTGVSINQ